MSTGCGDVGAYIVGALDAADRGGFELHLGGCATCRAAVAELAALPGLLSRIGLDEAVSGPPVAGDAMLERLLARATRERTRTRRRRLLAAAVGVAAAAVLGAGATIVAQDAGGTAPVATVTASAGTVHMRVEVAAARAGTRLTLRLSGVPREEHCRLVAVSDSGARETAASWEAGYDGTATISGMTAIPRAHLSRLVIETYDGHTLASAGVPTA